MKLIDKSALVAEIERRIAAYRKNFDKVDIKIARILTHGKIEILKNILSFLDTLEVKDIEISIPNIDDLFEENGIDPNSKVAKNFKESYYMALENFKAQKGE